MSAFRVHTTRPERLVQFVFGALWSGLLVWLMIVAVSTGAGAGILGLAVIGAIGYTILWRKFRLALVADHDGLTVRNVVGTYRVPRGSIASIEIAGPGFLRMVGRTVRIVRTDGTYVVVDAVTSSDLFARETRHLDRAAAMLSDWLSPDGP